MRIYMKMLMAIAAISGSVLLYGCGGGGGGGADPTPPSQTDPDRAAQEEARKKAEEEARKNAEAKKEAEEEEARRKAAEEEARKEARRKEEEALSRAELKAKTAADAAATAAMEAGQAATAAATAVGEADKYRMEGTLDADKAAEAASTAEGKSTEAAEASSAAQTALALARTVDPMSDKVRMYQQAAMDSAAAAAQSATQAANSATLARSHADRAVASATPYAAVTVGLTRINGNPTSATLLSYLRWVIGTSYLTTQGTVPTDPGLSRFETPATVRLARGSSSHQRALFHHAVALINRELPHEWHLRIGPDAPAGTAVGSVPQGQIIVDIAPPSDWNTPTRFTASNAPAGLAYPDIHKEFDRRQNRWEAKRMNSAKAYVRAGYSDQRTVQVLMHEIMHAMGINNHMDGEVFPDSLMQCYCLQITTDRVPEIDGAVLRAMYLRLSNGTEPEQLNASSLGHWDTQATDLSGRIGPVSFGVRHRNGVGVPWTRGSAPGAALADNRSLTGTAKWRGGLLGFTTGQRTVGGNTVISVELGTLTGRADFTKLQSWPSGQKPGALGTGTQWGDGDLGYTIAVSNNLLRSTGGDDGVVAGNFYSSDHSGVAGSLERSDLSAAFGAMRQ